VASLSAFSLDSQRDLEIGSCATSVPTGDLVVNRINPRNGGLNPLSHGSETIVAWYRPPGPLAIARLSSPLKQADDFLDRPDVVGDASFHRWRHAKR